MKRRWLPIIAPALLGLAIGVWFNLSDLPNPTIFLRIDMSVLIFLMGMTLSVLAAVGMLVWDLIDRSRLNTALQAAEERRRFLRRLDHELKNPLTAILAGLANLAAVEDEKPQQAALSSVEAQVQRLSDLVADLRKLSDLETRPLERAPINTSELLEEVFSLAQDRPGAAERQLNLSIPQAPWPLPSVSGDRDLLFLAVHNLLDNAIKFTHPGDTIEMRAVEDGDQVVVEIADTGPGIPETETPHVWEELYRGEGARGVHGSGLGLSLVRAIVARHEGEVSLRSRAGQGTVITMRLPVGDVSKQ
ncbi:MAG: HAMP domain-containing sensor histidine kinase [Anaerolineales bacterium]